MANTLTGCNSAFSALTSVWLEGMNITMTCSEEIEKIAHTLSDLTDLDPVNVFPGHAMVTGEYYIIDGYAPEDERALLFSMIIYINSDIEPVFYDPFNYEDILRENGVI